MMIVFEVIFLLVGLLLFLRCDFDSIKANRLQQKVKKYVRLYEKFYWNLRYEIQRVEKGYSEHDLWDLCLYLSDLLARSIEELRKDPYLGIPYPLSEKKNGEKEFDRILSDIVWTFKTANKVADMEYIYIPSDDPNFSRERRQWSRIKKKWPDVFEKVLTKWESKRLERGFDLFKKYFFDLCT